jgi:hypothetical protein
MAEDEAPWFTVGPDGQRKGKLIKIPLTYLGKEALAKAEVYVFGDHITGVSSEDGGRFHSVADLGNVVPGEGFCLTIRTDGEPGPLTFTLDLVANESHLRKFTVEVPEPTSVPVVTERPV